MEKDRQFIDVFHGFLSRHVVDDGFTHRRKVGPCDHVMKLTSHAPGEHTVFSEKGVVFAPVPRDYSFKLNKKEKRAALKSALTSRVAENKFIVLDELKLDEIKTKKFVEVMKNLKVEKALVVLNDMDVNVIKSADNVPTVKTAQTNELNVFDVLKYDTVVVTKDAVKTIEEVYA